MGDHTTCLPVLQSQTDHSSNSSGSMSETTKGKTAVQPSWLSTGESSSSGNGDEHQSSSGGQQAVKTEGKPQQGFKPKFVPKVPVKKEVIAPPAPAVSDARLFINDNISSFKD